MMQLIKPLGGALVRKPVTGEHLAADGEVLEHGSYWERRRLAGEVEILAIPADEVAPQKTGSKK